MSKTTHILLIVLMLIFLDAGFSLANTGVKFKYCFSDAFYHGENPLGMDIQSILNQRGEHDYHCCRGSERKTNE
ncbi:MAG: hypothetical protein JRI37_14390 [Deltaproteobacteria bacterium]|nr:hypothetical protein [Deltaproteobacteria bacterium]